MQREEAALGSLGQIPGGEAGWGWGVGRRDKGEWHGRGWEAAGWLGELVGLKPEDSGRQVQGDETRQVGCDEAFEYQTEESYFATDA